MEPRDDGEVSGRPSAHLNSGQGRDAIFSLNEAWLHTLDEYVTDTPLSEVILPVMRACFFGGATYAVLLAQRGHGNQVVSDKDWCGSSKPRSDAEAEWDKEECCRGLRPNRREIHPQANVRQSHYHRRPPQALRALLLK